MLNRQEWQESVENLLYNVSRGICDHIVILDAQYLLEQHERLNQEEEKDEAASLGKEADGHQET